MATYSWRTSAKAGRGKKRSTDELLEQARLAVKHTKKQAIEQKARHAESPYQKSRRIREGARVVLSNESPYTDAADNPKEGGPHSCVGTVLYVGGSIEVEWDNGISNHYHSGDLIAVKDNQKLQVTTGRVLSKADRTLSKAEEAYTGKFTVGTAVFLLPKFYSPQQSNPCIGSIHQCVGKVSKAMQREENREHISVNWANGARNSYTLVNEPGRICLVEVDDYKTLKQLLKDDPNLAFKAQFLNTGGLKGVVADHLSLVLEGN